MTDEGGQDQGPYLTGGSGRAPSETWPGSPAEGGLWPGTNSPAGGAWPGTTSPAGGAWPGPASQDDAPPAPSAPPAGEHPAGWHPDPWLPGQLRYWNGHGWTADVAQSGRPAGPGGPGGFDTPGGPAGPAGFGAPEGMGPSRRIPVAAIVIVLLVVMIAAAAIADAVTSRSNTKTSATLPQPTLPTNPANPTTPTSPGSSTPAAPLTPAQRVLDQLVVGQADVPSAFTVQLIPSGDQVSGQPTLDLCNGTFASEGLRSARRQTVVVDDQGNSVLSTEAVIYENPAATAQAFTEIKAVAAACPATTVPSPVGEPAVKTTFNPAPDAAWPQTPTVDRLAYDFTTTDDQSQTQHSVAVYLRRGSFLMGVYFPTPNGAQVPVDGQTTIPGIVTVFANRLAKLPPSAVNGTNPPAGGGGSTAAFLVPGSGAATPPTSTPPAQSTPGRRPCSPAGSPR